MRLLIVEDERKIAEKLKLGLEELHYEVDLAFDGEQGLQQARSGEYSLVILDRMLPQMDGVELLQKLRSEGIRVPVLLLTAMDRVHDRVQGLQAGADDYLVKPFAFVELRARIEAILRRSQETQAQDIRRLGPLTLCYSGQWVQRQGKQVELTPKEFRLLCLLAESPGQLVTRKEISKKVWGLQFDTETNLIDVAVRRLRQKLDDPYPVRLIRTVRGAGFVLELPA